MKRIIYTLPAIVLSCLIFYFSNQSQPPTPDLGFEWQDKVYHCTAFLMYGITLIIALSSYQPHNRKLVLLVIVLGWLYGASDEIHQYFVPGRSSEVADWVADAIGISLSSLLVGVIAPRIRTMTHDYRSRNDGSERSKEEKI